MIGDRFEQRLRDSLRTVANATLVPPCPELPVRHRVRPAVRLLAVAATVIVLVGLVAAVALVRTYRGAVPARPTVTTRSAQPAAAAEVSVQLSFDPVQVRTDLEQAFRQQGLNISVRLELASPGLVGVALGSGGGVHLDYPDGGCPFPTPGCRLVVWTDTGFTGPGWVAIGMEAGNVPYSATTDAFQPQELLHCHSDLLGERVSSAIGQLRRISPLVRYRRDGKEISEREARPLHIVKATSPYADAVWLDVRAAPYRPPAADHRMFDRGCL
jgi:hypothetical protein